jgi:hypothetical protein
VMSPPPAAFPTQQSANQPFTPAPAEGPNPGTGPTINSIPTDTTTMFAPADDSSTMVTPAPDTNAPATSSFFSNPSPATTEPPIPTMDNSLNAPVATPSEPSSAPVTPYSPEAPAVAPAPIPSDPQFAQPLPSPASVAQTGPHETSALLRVLYILAAVVFFAIYTVFWIKVFNLPFLF